MSQESLLEIRFFPFPPKKECQENLEKYVRKEQDSKKYIIT